MPPGTQGAPQTPNMTQNAPPLLLCEALGFSPQLLLDDIINIANNAVQDGVNGMEDFLNKWADERDAQGNTSNANSDATTYEVEQGLVAFQTLLEYHTDFAFDFFEAWCLRNIFMIPPDLPVVLPHQEGLDLTTTAEQEQDAMDEVEELRKRLDGQRKLNRLLKRSIKTSSRQLAQAETRLAQFATLAAPDGALDTLHALPPKLLDMYRTLSALPPLDVAPSVNLAEPGKRQWETNKSGYMNWALGRLLMRAEHDAGAGVGHGAVDRMDHAAAEVGDGGDLRRALDAVAMVQWDLDAVQRREPEDDNRMEE